MNKTNNRAERNQLAGSVTSDTNENFLLNGPLLKKFKIQIEKNILTVAMLALISGCAMIVYHSLVSTLIWQASLFPRCILSFSVFIFAEPQT